MNSVSGSKRELNPAHSRSTAPAKKKKKSPLFNQPQNHYAPPSVSGMTMAELSDWRKEQRKMRNRESAAASRDKTRNRIAHLEGEAAKWKGLCDDMQRRVQGMERHLMLLTQQFHSQQPQQHEHEQKGRKEQVIHDHQVSGVEQLKDSEREEPNNYEEGWEHLEQPGVQPSIVPSSQLKECERDRNLDASNLDASKKDDTLGDRSAVIEVAHDRSESISNADVDDDAFLDILAECLEEGVELDSML